MEFIVRFGVRACWPHVQLVLEHHWMKRWYCLILAATLHSDLTLHFYLDLGKSLIWYFNSSNSAYCYLSVVIELFISDYYFYLHFSERTTVVRAAKTAFLHFGPSYCVGVTRKNIKINKWLSTTWCWVDVANGNMWFGTRYIEPARKWKKGDCRWRCQKWELEKISRVS